jgi:hypothetical protein
VFSGGENNKSDDDDGAIIIILGFLRDSLFAFAIFLGHIGRLRGVIRTWKEILAGLNFYKSLFS